MENKRAWPGAPGEAVPSTRPSYSETVLWIKETLHVGSVTNSGAPLCRDGQYNTLVNFVKKRLETGQGGGMYLSGVPGTGKSLTAHSALESICQFEFTKTGPPAVISVNCMGLPDAKSVFGAMLSGVHEHSQIAKPMNGTQKYPIVYPCREEGVEVQLSKGDCQSAFEKLCMYDPTSTGRGSGKRRSTRNNGHQRGKIVVLLDEMDALISKDASMIYDLFNLAQSSERLVLIGAANSLDLTERILPELEKHGCKPQLVIFPAYTANQTVQVLKQRLVKCPWQIFDKMALELCGRSVAANSGDMRHALQACAKAVVHAAGGDQENREGFKKVGCREITQTLNEMKDMRTSDSAKSIIMDLPRAQKILLFTIWLQSREVASQQCTQESSSQSSALSTGRVAKKTSSKRKSRGKSSVKKGQQDGMNLGKVYERYSQLCKKIDMEVDSMVDVQTMLCHLSDAAFIDVKKKRGGKDPVVGMRLADKDLRTAFREHVLFREIVD